MSTGAWQQQGDSSSGSSATSARTHEIRRAVIPLTACMRKPKCVPCIGGGMVQPPIHDETASADKISANNSWLEVNEVRGHLLLCLNNLSGGRSDHLSGFSPSDEVRGPVSNYGIKSGCPAALRAAFSDKKAVRWENYQSHRLNHTRALKYVGVTRRERRIKKKNRWPLLQWALGALRG